MAKNPDELTQYVDDCMKSEGFSNLMSYKAFLEQEIIKLKQEVSEKNYAKIS